MNTAEQGKGIDQLDASLVRAAAIQDEVMVHGHFEVECFDKDGDLKWRDTIENVVTYLGKNHMLDNDLQTSVAIVGPYMGLISSVSYSGGPVIGDTMVSHSGWTEAGATNAPTYTAPRKTCAWNAAASGIKALSAALAFVFTGGGTVKGCFLVYGTGALSTIDNTAGTLFSAGTFTGGDKVVIATDTLNVSYSVSL
jgi:hypothetical protein